jgi:hypothetical protein
VQAPIALTHRFDKFLRWFSALFLPSKIASLEIIIASPSPMDAAAEFSIPRLGHLRPPMDKEQFLEYLASGDEELP